MISSTLYYECNYLTKLGFKFIHVSKGAPGIWSLAQPGLCLRGFRCSRLVLLPHFWGHWRAIMGSVIGCCRTLERVSSDHRTDLHEAAKLLYMIIFLTLNFLRSEQNVSYLAGDIFKYIFLSDSCYRSIRISLNPVPKVSIDSKSVLVYKYTVRCRYNAVQHVMILHTILQSQQQNINQHFWTLKRHPMPRPYGRTMGCLLR